MFFRNKILINAVNIFSQENILSKYIKYAKTCFLKKI